MILSSSTIKRVYGFLIDNEVEINNGVAIFHTKRFKTVYLHPFERGHGRSEYDFVAEYINISGVRKKSKRYF